MAKKLYNVGEIRETMVAQHKLHRTVMCWVDKIIVLLLVIISIFAPTEAASFGTLMVAGIVMLHNKLGDIEARNVFQKAKGMLEDALSRVIKEDEEDN